MCTKKKQQVGIIFGVMICVILVGSIMVSFIWKSRQVKEINCSRIPVQKEQKGVYFKVENVSFDDNGVLYITAKSEDNRIQYEYKNWVLGKGKNVYRKPQIILVAQDKQTAYKLPTYPHAMSSQSAETATTNELIAYAPRKLIKKGPFSIAIIFEDREKNETIIYPKEEQTVNEK